jgi:signal transduction histidine kinase/ligand-binding sensor domain-containing protein/DNA-binding response OmpR family regulator
MNKFVFFLGLQFIISVASSSVYAQIEQYKFKHLNINHGLTHNQVTAIFKDSKGFLWIGTSSGVNRYDGYNVKSFRHDPRDSSSLIHNSISQIFETPEGYVGIATPVGLTLFNPETEKFIRNLTTFYNRYGISDGTLNNIIKDSSGDFWFVQPYQLVRYNPTTGKTHLVQNIKGDSLSIVSDSIANLTYDEYGNHWVVHRKGVFEKLKSDPDRVYVTFRSYYFYNKNMKRPFEYRLLADFDGDLWFVTINDNQGVYYYNVKGNEFNHFTTTSGKARLNNNIIGGIVQDNKGFIWVGTDHGGVNLIDKKKFTVQYIYHRDEDDKTLGQNTISTLYRDDQGIVWIGTYKRGVSYYHENTFRFDVYKHNSLSPSSLPYADVNRFVEDDKGNLWIGTNGGGLIYFDRSNGTFRQYKHDPNDPRSLSGDVIVSLCMDSNKKLWIGTYYEGLNMFDGTKFTRFKYNPADPASLSGRSVWEVFEDSEKNLWIGTLEGGVNLMDRKTGKFQKLKIGGPNAIQSTYIAAISEDRFGNIWFGTARGIDVFSPKTKTFQHYEYSSANPNSISSNVVLDIKEDKKGRLWIGTNEGLNLFNREKKEFKTFWEKDGLPHNTILTIQQDKKGALWMSTPNGLCEMTVMEKESGELDFAFRNYTEPDGLQGLAFNENAAYKTRKGELVFGGPYGFNIINSEEMAETAYKAKVVFTDFQLFQKSVRIGEEIDGKVILNRSITEEDRIVLPQGRNFFSIEFSALNYLHPEKNEYQYKLEGLNTEWLPVDKNTHKITFTSLNPKDYKLRVKVVSNDRELKNEEAVLSITILPPFWKTTTAFVMYLFFLGAFLFVGRKVIQQREQMKFAIEHERHEAIRMHELDMMKIKFFTNVSHEFRTPLTLILTPLEKLIRLAKDNDLKNQYQLIHRNAKRLLNLVNQLLDFRKLEVQEIRFNPSEGDIINFIRDAVYSFSDLSEKKSIEFDFQSSVESLETIFDQDKLEKILFNLLSNAFKFTSERGKVSVRATLEEHQAERWLKIDVEDSGIGIPFEKQDKIFERFFQNELPRNIVNQGSGIGLSITKEFVKAHGGRIEVQSEPEKGSCFTVYIPIQEVFANKIELETDKISAPASAVASETELEDAKVGQNGAKTPATKKHTLLLVEDNDDFRFYLKDNLKFFYSIVEARNGLEGWRQALSTHPDLIVSDIMMPEMNGIDLCRRIKTDERVSHIPVILLTARTGEEQRLEGFETGADEYISKPFNFEILESRIRNLINQREKSHKVFRKTLDVKASELNITPLDTKFIENALKCVEQNVSSPDFSVEHLGRELGISRAYLYKKVLALTGKSPLEFIRTIRLQHAAQLLERSQLTVSEVAYKVGFNNPKYFTKYFKEEFNVLPSNYAASKKGEV